MSKFTRFALIAGLGAMTAACGSGGLLNRDRPDEFAVYKRCWFRGEEAKELPEFLRFNKFLVASELVGAFLSRIHKQSGLTRLELEHEPAIKGSDLAGTVARHPMHHLGGFYARPRPFLPGDFVTTDSGTGLVHMSPDHGEDDFLLCRANGLEPVFAVMADGRYRDDWEWLGAGDLDENGKERRRSVINKPLNSARMAHSPGTCPRTSSASRH